jgi:tetratricopeptide (TPR) repeat protein
MDVLRLQRKYAQAEDVLELGIRRGADPALLYLTLSDLAREEGDDAKAIDTLAKASELRPRDVFTLGRLGLAYLHAEDYHRARVALGRAIMLEPKYAAYYGFRAFASERLLDLEDALANYQKALDLDPGNLNYLSGLERIRKISADSRGSEGQ